MQDGTHPRIDRRVKQLLRQHFTGPWEIRRHFSTTWPPRSPDIIPYDFWLRGFLKDKIYSRRPASVADLKDSIPLHVLHIRADSFRSVVENTVLRLEHIVESEGGHVEQFYGF